MSSRNPTEQIAVVGGGTGAIGQAVVENFAGQGWTVVATYRRGTPSKAKGVHWIRFDGSDDSDVARLSDLVMKISGRLAAVVSTIGVPSSKQLVAETEGDEYADVFEGNVIANVRLWRAIYKRARIGKAGLVLLGSDTTATLRPRNGAYSAAKAALEALGVTLAAEEAPYGVRVNVVAPSLVKSPLAEQILKMKGVAETGEYYTALPWGRALTSTEVARVAVDIATNRQWEYVSGQTIRLAARIER